MASRGADVPLLDLDILPQPNDETCGPTCLHAVYRYWRQDPALPDVIASVRSLDAFDAGRGTLGVMLGIDALRRGLRATLFTFNLLLFDPTWFDRHGSADADLLIDKLIAQEQFKAHGGPDGLDDPRFRVATRAYIEFLRLGGSITFRELTTQLIGGFIRSGVPLLTGLSATYLYRCMREYGPNDDYDDIRGGPSGHFVVIHGYDPKSRSVTIADPLAGNPGFATQRYTVTMARLVAAIMLGVLTYDANLLVIQPHSPPAPHAPGANAAPPPEHR